MVQGGVRKWAGKRKSMGISKPVTGPLGEMMVSVPDLPLPSTYMYLWYVAESDLKNRGTSHMT